MTETIRGYGIYRASHSLHTFTYNLAKCLISYEVVHIYRKKL